MTSVPRAPDSWAIWFTDGQCQLSGRHPPRTHDGTAKNSGDLVPQIFIYRSIMPAAAHDVFAWHERPTALLELLPSSGFARVLSRSGGIRDGGRIVFTLGVGPLRIRWEAVHFGYVQDEQFCDEQVRGPFRVWRHTHRVTPLSTSSCRLEDRVEYALPGGRLIRVIAGPAVRRMLVSMFERRHAITRASFQPTTIDARGTRSRRKSRTL